MTSATEAQTYRLAVVSRRHERRILDPAAGRPRRRTRDSDLIAKPVVLAATAGTAGIRWSLMIRCGRCSPICARWPRRRSVFAAPEDWADPALQQRIGRAAFELVLLIEAAQPEDQGRVPGRGLSAWRTALPPGPRSPSTWTPTSCGSRQVDPPPDHVARSRGSRSAICSARLAGFWRCRIEHDLGDTRDRAVRTAPRASSSSFSLSHGGAAPSGVSARDPGRSRRTAGPAADTSATSSGEPPAAFHTSAYRAVIRRVRCLPDPPIQDRRVRPLHGLRLGDRIGELVVRAVEAGPAAVSIATG